MWHWTTTTTTSGTKMFFSFAFVEIWRVATAGLKGATHKRWYACQRHLWRILRLSGPDWRSYRQQLWEVRYCWQRWLYQHGIVKVNVTTWYPSWYSKYTVFLWIFLKTKYLLIFFFSCSCLSECQHLTHNERSFPAGAVGDPDCLRMFTSPFQIAEFSKEDMAKSLLHMISNDIGQLACLYAKLHNLSRVYFGGFFIRGHPVTMHTITYSINFFTKARTFPPLWPWTSSVLCLCVALTVFGYQLHLHRPSCVFQGEVQALFLRHEGYLGAIGAFLKGAEEDSKGNMESCMRGVTPEWNLACPW